MPRRIVAVLLGTIGGAIVTLAYPYLGLLQLVYLTFGRPQDDRPNVVVFHIPLVISSLILFGLVARIGSLGPAMAAAVKRVALIMVYYAVMIMAAANNWSELSSGRLYDFSTVILLCVVTLTLVTTEKRLLGYVNAIIGSGLYVALRVIRNPSTISEDIGGQHFERAAIARGSGNFGNSNYMGLLMAMTILLCLSLLTFYRKLWQRLILIAIGSTAAYVFFRAQSRGATLGLAAGLVLLWVVQKHKLRTAVVAIVLLSLATFMAPQSYWDRVHSISHYQDDSSATTRLEVWKIALTLIPEHPLLGVGPENLEFYAPTTAHNAYVQAAAELGIPGLLLYLAILFSGVRSALRARKLSFADSNGRCISAISYGVFACLVLVIVQGFTTGLAHREFVYVLVTLGFLVRRFSEQPQDRLVPAPEISEEPAFGMTTFELAEKWRAST